MKNNIFRRTIGGGFEAHEKFRKKVGKIVKTRENKRNFLPLFEACKMQIMSEEERKNYLFNVAKKYFDIKAKSEKEQDII